MGVRETFNRNPAIAAAIAAVCVALGVSIWFVSAKEESGQPARTDPKSWYTIDDGRTWFVDSANKVVPFEHQGKPAYRCFVWRCGATKFVSHLERLNPAARGRYGPQDRVDPWKLPPGAEQVKRPLRGDVGWLDVDAPDAGEIQRPRCPGGGDELPTPVPAE